MTLPSRRPSRTVAWIAGALLALLTSRGEADTVTLKTGEVFSGRVLRATKDEVSIQLDSGGILSFRSHRVAQVRWPGQPLIGIETNPDKPDAIDPSKGKEPERPASAEAGGGSKEPAGQGSQSSPELSSFPLHARRAPGAAASSGAQEPKEASRIRDPHKGYSLIPPRGFKPWSDPKLPSLIRGFMDPATQANVTISLYESDESLDSIKDGIVALLPRHSNAKVVREVRRNVQGPNGYNGWILSLENTISETTVHQLQLLAKEGRRVFIVTYSAAARNYPSFAKAFEASLESFRFERDSSGGPSEAPKPDPGAKSVQEPSGNVPGKSNLPPEVERYLKKGSQPSSSGPRIPYNFPHPDILDPNRLKDQSDRIIERVDERVRGAPLGGYR